MDAEPEISTPMDWRAVVGIVALVGVGLVFKFWVYTASPDWLVRMLGFLGF